MVNEDKINNRNKKSKLEEFKNLEQRFELISRTYLNDFKKCIVLLLDRETGKITKQSFDLQ